jgi:hypothetical protein
MAVVTAPLAAHAAHREPVLGSALIGFAHALAAPETAWSLVDAGVQVTVFARRGSSPPLRHARGITVVEITAPEDDTAAAIEDLRALLDSGCYASLMPLDDASLWLCDALAADVDAPVIGPVGSTAELALDKRRQLSAAADAGFRVPATKVVSSRSELTSPPPLPLILKSAHPATEREGRLVRSVGFVCGTAAEVEAAAAAWNGDDPLLVQPLIDGVGEGLFGIAGPAGISALSAHRRVRMMNPQGSGSSACMSTAVDPELAAAAERMLAAVGWNGMFMLEFLRDAQGTPWFMELNGRPWGSMALARRGGLEYPAWAVRQVIDPGWLPTASAPVGHTCRHLGRELVHLLMVLRGPKSEALVQWPGRRETLRRVLRVSRHDHWYNYRRGNARVFWADAAWTVRQQLLKRSGS